MNSNESEDKTPNEQIEASEEPTSGSTATASLKNSTKRKSKTSTTADGISALPKSKSTMVLRLVAQMFHQHSDMFLQQAAVLERIAANPSDPSAWSTEEPSPESVQDRLYNENVVSLAIKSYESMLEVQKRVEYMERLMIRNGIEKNQIVSSATPATATGQLSKVRKLTPFSMFQREHSMRLAHDLGEPIGSAAVMKEVKKLWRSVNPQERQRFTNTAEHEEQRRKRKREEDEKTKSEPRREESGDAELNQKEAASVHSNGSEVESSSGESDNGLLFQEPPRHSKKDVRRKEDDEKPGTNDVDTVDESVDSDSTGNDSSSE